MQPYLFIFLLIDLFLYRLLRIANGNPREEQEIITWLRTGRIPEKETPQYMMSTEAEVRG